MDLMEALKGLWGMVPDMRQQGQVPPQLMQQPAVPMQLSTQPAGYQHPDDYAGYSATHPGSIRKRQSGVGYIVQQNSGTNPLTDMSEFSQGDASIDGGQQVQQDNTSTGQLGGIGGSEGTDKTPKKFNFGNLLRGLLPIAIPTVTGAILGSRSNTFGPLAGGMYGLSAGVSGMTERKHERDKLSQAAAIEQLKQLGAERDRLLAAKKQASDDLKAQRDYDIEIRRLDQEMEIARQNAGYKERELVLKAEENKIRAGEIDNTKLPKIDQLMKTFVKNSFGSGYGKKVTIDDFKNYINAVVGTDQSLASGILDQLGDHWWQSDTTPTLFKTYGIIKNKDGTLTYRIE